MNKALICLLLGCVFSYPAFSSTAVLEAEKITQVAESQQWQHLLHYRHHPYSGRFISQADSPNFFLSEQGKTSLAAELEANLQAFLVQGQADNQSAQCQFPARYFWLKQQFAELNFIDQPCPEFNAWQHELAARYLTIVFPAAHINSPSSMYGHTLVRLDRADETRSKLLAYSVNFAANADPTDNELVFSWKGLTGGYPGVVSVLPYYAKTNEYSHLEYRDIWEYRLNLSADESAQFVRHVWETKDSYFDYYFFDENCSYRLLALLDASSERLDLAGQFNFVAMPVDTVRAIKEAGLIETADYRPSAASEMEHKSAQSSAQVLKIAKQLVDSDDDINALIQDLSAQDQTRTLELAYSYARYLSIKKRKANPQLRARTVAILSARAKQSQEADYQATPTPAYRDDEGHLSQRVTLAAGAATTADSSAAQGYADLAWRIAFHDVLDLPQGFAQGAQIEMGQFNLRAWEGGSVQLQQFKVIDILSLSEQTHFQSPIAWSVSTGLERFVGADAELYGYLKTAFGGAWLSALGRVYALAEVQLLADNQFHNGAQFSAGPRVGWLWQGRQLQASLEGNYQGLAWLDKTQRSSLSAQLGVRLHDNVQLRLAAKQQWFELGSQHWHQYEIQLGINGYF